MRTRLGRSNFAQLVKAATAPAAVAGACVGCWGLAAAWMIARGLPFTATDDFPRLIHAMAWARDPFFTPNRDTYWLPVPYLVQGLGCRFLQPLAGFYWYAWLSAGFMAAGCAAAIAAGRLVMGKGTDPGARLRVVLATLALLGSVPVAWRLAASGMSEPIYLAWQGLMIWAMVGARVRPTRGRWALLLIAGVLYQATRYEGWPLAIAAWVLAHGWSSWQDRRDRVRLALGILVLAAWPVFWMGYNASVAGDPLHFLRWARLMAAQRPELAEASLGHRVAFLSLTAWRQGWPIVLLKAAW